MMVPAKRKSALALPTGAFRDRADPPDERNVSTMVGDRFGMWKTLQDAALLLSRDGRALWNFAYAATGWTLRVYDGDRVVLYLIPQPGSFVCGLVLGNQVYDRAKKNASKRLKERISKAVLNAEGAGFRFPVSSEEDLEDALSLLQIKMNAVKRGGPDVR